MLCRDGAGERRRKRGMAEMRKSLHDEHSRPRSPQSQLWSVRQRGGFKLQQADRKAGMDIFTAIVLGALAAGLLWVVWAGWLARKLPLDAIIDKRRNEKWPPS